MGKAVEGALDSAYGVQDRAVQVAKKARGVAESVVESGKQEAVKVASRLEVTEVRAAREAVEKDQGRDAHWWQFWKKNSNA